MRKAMITGLAVVAVGAFASPGEAQAATYEIDNFASPSSPLSWSGTGAGIFVDQHVTPSALLYVFTSATNPAGATSVSYGAGALTVSSDAGVVPFAQVGYDAYAGSSVSVDTTPYKYYELSFSGGSGFLNINAEMYSSTGPVYYTSNGVNVGAASHPFNVYIPIGSVSGFDFTNVNGFLFEIEAFNVGGGPSWTVDNFQLSTTAPEPSTWILMLAGFGGLGFVGYRSARRLQAAAIV